MSTKNKKKGKGDLTMKPNENMETKHSAVPPGLSRLPKITPKPRIPVEQTNAYFAKNNAEFQLACTAAGIKNTTRQASKYKMKKGQAWEVSHGRS